MPSELEFGINNKIFGSGLMLKNRMALNYAHCSRVLIDCSLPVYIVI